MTVRLKEYIKLIEGKVRKNEINRDLAKDIGDCVEYLQHERLIKLITTTFICAVIIAFLACALCFEDLLLYLLFGIVFVLFIPYVINFYMFENNFIKLSNLYFKVKNKITE